MAVPETGVKPIQYFDDPADYFRQLYDDERDVSYHLADWQAYKASGLSPSEYYGYDTVEFTGPTSIKKHGSDVNLLETGYGQNSYSTPTYRSEWDNTADALAKAALEMNYENWQGSDQYKSLEDMYREQGKLSMQDILGQMAARTGGLASSWSEAVAGQQYNDYMAQLQDVARQMYNNERASAIENAQMAVSYAQNDYQRYLDALNQATYEREWQNQLEQQNYARSQNEMNSARDRISAFLQLGGSINDIDPSVLAASGYSSAELAALGGYYTPTTTTTTKTSNNPAPAPNASSGSLKGEAAMLYKEIVGKRSTEDAMFSEVRKARASGKITEAEKEELMNLILEEYK